MNKSVIRKSVVRQVQETQPLQLCQRDEACVGKLVLRELYVLQIPHLTEMQQSCVADAIVVQVQRS